MYIWWKMFMDILFFFQDSPFFQQYELDLRDNILGDGSFSVCRECIQKSTGQHFAVKIVSRKLDCQQEINLLRACQGHPNIVNLHEVFYDEVSIDIYAMVPFPHYIKESYACDLQCINSYHLYHIWQLIRYIFTLKTHIKKSTVVPAFSRTVHGNILHTVFPQLNNLAI